MKSKRGVALAYVIVITAALLVVAAAFVSIAAYNLSASQNSLESRQAYLDAKSAIEYGRAYLANNPSAANSNFTVLRTASGSGFKIGSDDKNAVIATYSGNSKTINAKVPYKSAADRFRLLGFKFNTSSGPVSDGLPQSDFLVGGGGYGLNEVLNYYNYSFNWYAFSQYPFISKTYRQTSGSNTLKAPQIFIFNKSDYKGDCLRIYDYHSLTLISDLIYLSGGIDSYHSNGFYMPLYLQTYGDDDRGIIYFTEDVTEFGKVIAKANTFYSFKNDCNLYNLKQGDLTEIEQPIPSKTTDEIEFIRSNLDNIISGDSYDRSCGAGWAPLGSLSFGQPTVTGNRQTSVYNADTKSKYVYFYANDCTNWDNVFRNNDWSASSTATYSAKGIYFRYVNYFYDDFVIPMHKSVVFQADSITLSTEFSDDDVGKDADHRPAIQGHDHSGKTEFILKPLNNSVVKLYIPNELNICQNKNHVLYTIQPGYYSIPEMDLFSDEAEEFFTNPDNIPIDDGPGGSGGGITTGGVYTDGQ